MNIREKSFSVLVMMAAACLAAQTRAQSLDVTLVNSNVSVTQGATEADFFASISNPTASTIFLNGDNPMTGPPFLSVNDAPFMSNAPLFLGAGQSTGPFELFAVELASPTIAPGTYSGNVFSILGGFSMSDLLDVADSIFSVTVTGPSFSAPEMDPTSWAGALTLLGGCLAILCSRRAVRIGR
jgi:hypothetical protein